MKLFKINNNKQTTDKLANHLNTADIRLNLSTRRRPVDNIQNEPWHLQQQFYVQHTTKCIVTYDHGIVNAKADLAFLGQVQWKIWGSRRR